MFPLWQKGEIESRRRPQPLNHRRKVVVFTGQAKHTGLSRRFRWLPEKYRINVVVFLGDLKQSRKSRRV
jgi:hypothetical protein